MTDAVREALEAAPGTVWVCGACGKRASHRYDGGIDRGWDESCMLHAVLCDEASIEVQDGRVVKAAAVEQAAKEAG